MHASDLRLSRLTLTQFRNYRDVRLETAALTVVLTGPNGAGKTNLLEAISMLTSGRGLRCDRATPEGLPSPRRPVGAPPMPLRQPETPCVQDR